MDWKGGFRKEDDQRNTSYFNEMQDGGGAWHSMISDLSIIRATETYQQAGAYYVRIQAMAKKHHITLRQEFDDHDTPDTKYIVVTHNDFPVATARMYSLDESSVMIGRVVVLQEYRHKGIGTMVVKACEEWAKELGYVNAVVESRDNKTEFYKRMGYKITGETIDGDTFRCIGMEKAIGRNEESI